MHNNDLMTESPALDGGKLWDEILKAIIGTMPSQLFPLFKEVYGRDYPRGTPIVLLGTETSSFQEGTGEPPGSTLMDIALLVAGTDYYHLECQTYSLEEIRKKHLILFIPYTILRLRPRLRTGVKHPLSERELTEFVENVILILNKELSDGYLTEREYDDYVRLFRFAANRVLTQHPQMREEVNQMTEPLIKLPSVIIRELEAQLADRDAQLADRDAQLADQKAQLADQKAQLADQKAEVQRLQELVAQLSPATLHHNP